MASDIHARLPIKSKNRKAEQDYRWRLGRQQVVPRPAASGEPAGIYVRRFGDASVGCSTKNLRISVPIGKCLLYGRCMSLVEVVDDLITLQQLADHEDDPDRRRSLDAIRDRLAARDCGVKVSEAARVLGFSQPTIRSWIEAGVLDPVPSVTPVRVEVSSLAAVKHAVDLLRQHSDDRRLLADVMRLLRDRAALEGEGVRQSFDDLAAGRVVPLTDDLLEEIAAIKGKKRSRSKSI